MGKDLDSLPIRAGQAAAGVRDVNRAFSELSQQGKLTNGTLEATIGLLVRMNPAMGAVAEAGYTVYRSFQLLKELDLADDFAQLGATVKVLGLEFDVATGKSAAMAGKTGELAEAAGRAADAEARIKNEQAQWSALVEHHTQLVKDGKETEAEASASLAQASVTIRDHIATLEEKKAAADGDTAAIEKQTAAQDRLNSVIQRSQEKMDTFVHLQDLMAGKAGSLQELFSGENTKTSQRIAYQQQEIDNYQQLIQARHQAGVEDAEADAQAEEAIALLQQRIANEQREVEILRDLGSMAEQAIGQEAAGAYNAYADALDKTVSMQNLLSDSTGRALQNTTSQVIRSLGQQAAVKGAMATADAVVDLALQNYEGAALNAEAAGLYFAIAALAGVGAGALSVNSGSRGGGGGGGGGFGGKGSGGDTVNQYVTVIGTLDDRDANNLAAQLARARERGDLDS